MIATLEGMVSEKMPSGVILDVNGVGYGVLITAADNATLAQGKKTKLYIYEHIKEDAHDLYGFSGKETKQLFTQLLSVKNVGPKVAIAILDIGSVDDVRAAIAGGNVKQLQTAKGVGKRAAEQIVVELRDKVGSPVGDEAEQLIGRAGVDMSDEAVQALMSLGFTESDAATALSQIDKSLSTEERIKQALKGKK